MLRLSNVRISEDLSHEEVIRKALRKYRIRPEDVLSWRLVRKSIDARDKSDVHYRYTADVEVRDESRYPRISRAPSDELPAIACNRVSPYRPIIVGSGPAGLFCALTLVENGYQIGRASCRERV